MVLVSIARTAVVLVFEVLVVVVAAAVFVSFVLLVPLRHVPH